MIEPPHLTRPEGDAAGVYFHPRAAPTIPISENIAAGVWFNYYCNQPSLARLRRARLPLLQTAATLEAQTLEQIVQGLSSRRVRAARLCAIVYDQRIVFVETDG